LFRLHLARKKLAKDLCVAKRQEVKSQFFEFKNYTIKIEGAHK